MLYKEDIEILRDFIARMDSNRIVYGYCATVDERRIKALCEDKYLIRLSQGGNNFWVEPKAISELNAFDERLNQERAKAAEDAAKQVKQNTEAIIYQRQNRHHDYFVAMFSAVIGALTTLLVEHFDDVLAFFKNVIH